MPFIFTYLIKLSFAIAIFYCMYRFALRQLTFYRWNRYFLAGYGLLSLVLPFVNIDFLLGQDQNKLITSIPSINNVRLSDLSAVNDDRYWFMDHYPVILVTVFAIGAAFVVIRVLRQYRSLLTIRKAAVLIGSQDIELYDVDADISPFSFNNSIYFNSSLHATDELAKILQHEFVHVKQKHIIDLVIAEILCVVNWFNPFVWMLRKAIRQNLEFIADNQVLESGIDAKQYQYLLLKVTGITPLGLTNHFNISSLKKRIAMMNKMRTAKVHLLKFLFILPLLSLVLVSFRNATAAANENASATAITKILQVQKDTVPPPPPLAPPRPPAHPMGVRKTPPRPPAEPTTFRIDKKDLPADVSSITMSRNITVNLKDGKTETYDMNSVESMNAFEKKYGTKLPPPPPPVSGDGLVEPQQSAPGSSDTAPVGVQLNKPGAGKVMFRAHGAQPLIILDGKELPPETDLNKVIDPNDIESITVLKDASARSLYGEAAANGVIIIASKANRGISVKSTPATNSKPATIQLRKPFKGLITLDGKEISQAELDKIDPDTIESVDVLKGVSATTKYGKKGEEGVIEVKVK